MTLSQEKLLRKNIEQDDFIYRITNCIRSSLELKETFTRIVAEVRFFLAIDRVMVYQFHPDGSGKVVAESIHDNILPSLLGLNFPADDIPAHAREMFVKSRVRSIVNVETGQIGKSAVYERETGEIISEDISYRNVDPCHIEYLTAMGVKSSVVTPIFHQEQLWGLLVSHHSESRSVSEQELKVMQMLVAQLSLAITQDFLLTEARSQAKREAIINNIATLLHSLKDIPLQAALEKTVAAFEGCGGRLCIGNPNFKSFTECLETGSELIKLYTDGKQPVMPDLSKYSLMEQYSIWKEYYKSNNYNVWAISDINQIPGLRNLQTAFQGTKIRSILMIPLQYHQQLLGYLSIFREEIDTETLWAGRFDSDERQIYPRQSFEIWRESKTAQARQWTKEEIELAEKLGTQFSTAIHQYDLHQQLQDFNSNLEKQVKQRTDALQQAAKQRKILFEVVTKIRESLDLDVIFQTTTQEVCQWLQADRVAVYRFNADWSGEFIAEFVNEGWVKLVGSNIVKLWKDSYIQETQGGRCRFNQSIAVDDIYQADYADCHIELLERFQAKAYAIAPIFIGEKLWGMLAAYQNSAPRHWQGSEIKFLCQTAIQFGVALQQAELLNQSRLQTEQIAQTLNNLRKAQTQLVQSEKMSSLGQLVAGIAHEINNPVNFIYGNINHIHQYTKDLLGLLELYQDCNGNNCEISERADEIDLEFLVDDLPKMLSSMKIGASRIREIVLSLRNFSRLDEADLKGADIHQGIESTLLILQYRLKAKPDSPGIEVIKEYGNLPEVECYAGQLNQVLMNVLSNAIDALEEGISSSFWEIESDNKQSLIPKIRICTQISEDNNQLVIRIADNGLGMTETVMKRMFDPFFTTKPVGKGTGLGLSISYQIIVDKHDGIFNCKSLPNKGTEFSIEIPIKQSR
ncbi:GAF domain-containing protein [Calothrix sp. CCY 0018]|uniref:GAF domain-containing sensor histidine kinase n=1 Tax=Calothrix sp. CCY 0018 TaxID=3103864 RepID=UPI0039C69B78